MTKKNNLYKDNIEPFNRYCPICGKQVKKNTPLHHCKESDLLKLQQKQMVEEDLSFDDKIEMGNIFLEPDDFFYNDDDDANF